MEVRGDTDAIRLDNFEWVHRYRPTFSLVAVDRSPRSVPQAQAASLGWITGEPTHL
jgi:hypothetical protein